LVRIPQPIDCRLQSQRHIVVRFDEKRWQLVRQIRHLVDLSLAGGFEIELPFSLPPSQKGHRIQTLQFRVVDDLVMAPAQQEEVLERVPILDDGAAYALCRASATSSPRGPEGLAPTMCATSPTQTGTPRSSTTIGSVHPGA
jgi:hypothetical protein